MGASARKVTESLTTLFLENGNFALASGPVNLGKAGVSAAASAVACAPEFNSGFAGLAVQSVGFTKGAEPEEVDIYVIAAPKKKIKELAPAIDGVKVNVLKMGRVVVRPEAASAAATNKGHVFLRKNRVACGSSCAPAGQNYSGTFGLLAKRKGTPALLAVSNNHVFAACNHMPVGQPILSPSNMDGQPNQRAPGEICRHLEIIELRSGEPGLVPPCEFDVAVAEVRDDTKVSSWQGDAQDGYDTPKTAIDEIRAGIRVKKFGRTTGLTFGTMRALIPGPYAISYVQDHFKARIWFRNVWTVRADAGQTFALGGDSGSLVVTEDEKHAVGLLFAADPTGEFGWLIPMDRIEKELKISLVDKHGV